MSGLRSRNRGKRGERLFRDVLRSHGFEARRGVQFAGGPDSPDVVCEGLAGFHFEVKFTERLQLRAAMQQATLEAGDKIPVVAHKSSRKSWLVVLRADDFLRLMKESRT